jgi:energy-coupling factor transporter ATP-binding protein EcfA2
MTSPNRNDASAAAQVAEQCFPDAAVRRLFAEILAKDARAAAESGEQRWSVTLFPRGITMNVGAIYTSVFNQRRGVLDLVVELDQLEPSTRAKLDALGMEVYPFDFRSQGGTKGISLPVGTASAAWPLLEAAHLASVRRAARWRVRVWKSHSPGVVKWLEETTGLALSGGPASSSAPAEPGSVLEILNRALAGFGLSYGEETLAAFYTALQTKGFVILGGISGTGKTKLVQALAKALGHRAERRDQGAGDEQLELFMLPYMKNHARMSFPRAWLSLFEPPPVGSSADVTVTFDGQTSTCRYGHRSHPTSPFVELHFRGPVRDWFNNVFQAGRVLHVRLRTDEDHRLQRVELATEPPGLPTHRPCELLFLPVRPDWRDSRALLGYFNPITGAYQSTPFLQFVAKAADSWRARDGRTWIVVLDEMNLARVEYYFADVLSVMESGRVAPGSPDEGTTEQALSLDVPEGDGSDEAPARTLRLPPNLFVVGTVNVDETTHAFSPKVLDRAFFIDLTEVDFSDYPLTVADRAISGADREKLTANFTGSGRFPRLDKRRLPEIVEKHGELRERLVTLNQLLREHELHFGYRVFDEIFAFVDAGLRNGTYSERRGGAEAAFDAAVAMKVLPKFHGSADKLREPLLSVLAWCKDPDEPDRTGLETLEKALEVAPEDAALAITAERVLRMLRALKANGYASFV